MAEPYVWVQPKDRDDLIRRLALARDLNVPERERENLCSAAIAELTKPCTCGRRFSDSVPGRRTTSANAFCQQFATTVDAGRSKRG